MANRAKVEIAADFDNKGLLSGTVESIRAMDSMERAVTSNLRAIAGAWSIKEIAEYTLQSARAAAQNDLTQQSFERLANQAGSTADVELAKLRVSVGNTLSDLQLLQKVGAAVDATLTFDQSRIALEFLRRYSLAYGKDFEQLTSTIFTGLQRGSTLMLDDAGIIIDASDQIFSGLNEVQKKTALVEEAIKQMSEKMDRLPTITSNAVSETDRFTASLSNLSSAVGDLISDNVTTSLASLNRLLRDTTDLLSNNIPRSTTQEGVLQDIARYGFTDQEVSRLRGARAALERLGASDEDIVRQDTETFRQIVADRIKQGQELEKWLGEFQRNTTGVETITDQMVKSVVNGTAALEVFSAAGFKSVNAWEELIRKVTKAKAAAQTSFEDLEKQFTISNPTLSFTRADLEISDSLIYDTQKGQAEIDQYLQDQQAMREIRLNFLRELEEAELATSRSRIEIEKRNLGEWAGMQARRIVIAGLGFDDLLRLNQVYNERLRQIEDTEARAAREQEVREILLVFTADASQVQSESDLAAYSVGLFVESLSRVSPIIATLVSGIEQVATGYVSGGVVGGLASGAGFALNQSMAHFAADAAKWRAEVENLSRELEDARDITGAYASEVANLSILQQEQQFRDTISSLPEQLGRGFNEVNWAHFVDFENFTTAGVNEIENVIAQLTQAFSNNYTSDYLTAQGLIVQNAFANLEQLGIGIKRFSGETFTFAQAMDDFRYAVRINDIDDPTQKLTALSDSLKQIGVTIDDSGILSGANLLSLQEQRTLNLTIKDIQEEVTRAEIDAREEQANILISAIEEQAKDVENALIDAQEASKRAVLRSVSTIFDIQEIALRQSFVPQLIGARTDPIETARVIAEANREIELLRLAEEAATTARLAELRDTFETTQKENYEISQLQIEAIKAATENTSLAFSNALALEMGSLSGDFNTFLDLAHSATTEEIVGSLNTSRFAMLDKLDVVSVSNTSDLKATAGAITISVDAAAQKITGSISAIHVPDPNIPDYGDPQWSVIRGNLDYLQDIRDYTWATQNHLYDMLQDQRNASPGQVLSLTSTNDILTSIRAYGWATQHHLFDIATDGLDRLVSAIHSPLWAESGVPNSGNSNNRSGGGDLVFQVNINIDSVLGTVDGDDARELFQNHLEDLITESMTYGEIRQALNQFIGDVIRQSIPSTIRT